MMGGVETAGSSTIHIPGYPCPVSRNLSCTDASVEGEGELDLKDGGPPRFHLPKIRASFGIRPWEELPSQDPQGMQSFQSDSGPATYAIHTMDFGVETAKLPTSAYRFRTDPPLAMTIPAVRHIGIATLNVELKKVPYLPSITIMKLIARLNDALFFGAPKGRILFAGGRTSKEFVSDGTRVQNVSYVFKYRERDWNMRLRPDDGTFDFIQTSGGAMPQEYADLRPLIVLQAFAGMGSISGDW
jgi:hypothetical protein